jgi:hypothetical protein
MDYETFVTTVAQLARTDRAGTERAIRATFADPRRAPDPRGGTSGRWATPRRVGPLVAHCLWGAQRFDVDEFVRRVGERAQVDLSTAQRYAAAVFTALSQAVPEEYDNIVAQLTNDFAPLLSRVRTSR